MRRLRYFILFIILISTTALFALQFSRNYQAFQGHRTTVFSVAFTKDGRYLAASGGKNEIIVWDVKTGRKTARGATNPLNKPMNYMAVNDTGTLIAATGFMDPAVKICRFSDGALLRTIRTHRGEKSGLAFIPGTDQLVIAGVGGTKKASLQIWNAATGRLVKTLYRAKVPVSREYLSGLSFSRDGRYLAAGISNNRHGLLIFDMKGKRLVKYIRYRADVSDVAFSPDGRRIAGGSTNNKVILWDRTTGRVLKEMAGHKGFVSAVSFSPDGKFIASVGTGYKNVFRLWDARTGRLVQTMVGHNQGVNDVEFSPDGSSLAVGVTTHGDLFKIDTVRLFSTAAAARKMPWHKVSSRGANLRIEFPGAPQAEERYKSDRHYTYSRFQLRRGDASYYVRVVEHKYRISSSKAASQVDRITRRLVAQKSRRTGSRVKYSRSFNYRGGRGTDSLVVRVRRGTTYRYRYRVIFPGNFLYEIRYQGTGAAESINEKRFFDSFGTMK